MTIAFLSLSIFLAVGWIAYAWKVSFTTYKQQVQGTVKQLQFATNLLGIMVLGGSEGETAIPSEVEKLTSVLDTRLIRKDGEWILKVTK